MRFLLLDQPPVDSEPDDHLLVGRLDVDVRRAIANGAIEEVVDPANDRRFVGLIDDVLELFDVLVLPGLREGRGVLPLVDAVDDVVDRFPGRGHRLDRLVEERSQVVEGVGVEGVGDRDHDAPIALLERQHVVLTREVDRHPIDQLVGDLLLLDLGNERHPHLAGEGAHHRLLFDDVRRQEDVPQTEPVLFGARTRGRERLGVEDVVAQQNFPDVRIRSQHVPTAPAPARRRRRARSVR